MGFRRRGKLGFVHANAEKYVSEESFQRRAQQVRRNRKMLESTAMMNEDGEQFALAQLSDKSVANPQLRRGSNNIPGYLRKYRFHELILLCQ